MGAYENQQITATRWDIASSSGPPPDGQVGINDFLALLADWGPCPGCGADFNHDLQVGINDFLELLAHWCDPDGPTTCTICSVQAPSGGSPPPEVEAALAAMGFSSLDDYGAWLAQASDVEAYASAVELAGLLGG